MKNTLIKTLGALVLVSAIGSVAVADPITGGIAFASSPGANPAVTLTAVNPSDPNTQYVAQFFGANITAGDGTFATVASSPTLVTAADSSFDVASLLLSGPNPAFTAASLIGTTDLWSFVAGGVSYTFDPTTITVTDVVGGGGITSWGIAGNGNFSATGFDTTGGIYDLTFNATGVTSFSATSNANVPDSGATALLLGLGALAIAAYGLKGKLIRA